MCDFVAVLAVVVYGSGRSLNPELPNPTFLQALNINPNVWNFGDPTKK